VPGPCDTGLAVTSEFGPGFGPEIGPDPEPDDRQPFGVNSAQVWVFLEELRELDLDRAVMVWDGYQIAQSNGYPTALAAAEQVAERHRPAAWSRARQAAAMVARKRLGDLTLTGEIIAVLADVAGSLVVRDMLPGRDFKLLQLPWTWHGEREPGETAAEIGTAAGAVVVEPVAASAAAPVAVGRTAGHALPTFLSSKSVRFGARAFTVIATVTILASLTRLTPDSGNVDTTDSPGGSSVGVFGPGPSLAAPSGGVASSAPASTGAPSGPGQTAAPQPPAPTHPPKPTPRPTPTPKPMCTVISLLDVPTVKAQEKWTAAGFTAKVNFSPAVPPQYRIQWQSLAAGASVTCAHAITVSDHAR
jgi:hypothetical protein